MYIRLLHLTPGLSVTLFRSRLINQYHPSIVSPFCQFFFPFFFYLPLSFTSKSLPLLEVFNFYNQWSKQQQWSAPLLGLICSKVLFLQIGPNICHAIVCKHTIKVKSTICFALNPYPYCRLICTHVKCHLAMDKVVGCDTAQKKSSHLGFPSPAANWIHCSSLICVFFMLITPYSHTSHV